MKRHEVVLAGLFAVVLLIAAAFAGGRLFGRPSAAGGLLRAPELPAEAPAAEGVFVRADNNIVVIGSGNVSLTIDESAGRLVSIRSVFDGPEFEIVATHDTHIFRDTTRRQYNVEPPGMSSTALPVQVEPGTQQTLEAGSLQEIGENSLLQVWGEKRGQRIIASALTYTLPLTQKPKPGE